jgi:hypothetical protein
MPRSGNYLRWLENLFAPQVFASEATSFALGAGVVTITLSSHRFDNSVPPGVQKRVVVGRLVMPIGAAQGLPLPLTSRCAD